MQIKRFRGAFKGIFFYLKLHGIFPVYLFNFIGHISKLSRWIRKHEKIAYSDFYSPKFEYNKRIDLFSYIIEKEQLDTTIDYLEFGVSRGVSFKWWANRISNPGARFYGFDTFTGLPEDWGPFKKGDMGNDNKPPEMNDPRCTFYQGLFQQTLPGFLQTYSSRNRKIVHLDADLYSATLYVLSSLSPVLKPNDILFFDEFNVPMHEFKAFTEWTESFYIDYEVMGAVNNYYQVAVKLK